MSSSEDGFSNASYENECTSCSDHDEGTFDDYHSFKRLDKIDEDDQSSKSSPDNEPIQHEDEEEILEENNNDPNNNQDDENDSEVEGVVAFPLNNTITISPQPGCSKDFDAVDNSSKGSLNNKEDDRLAYHVHKHISRLTYESIAASIKKAKITGKKILNLSNLLSEINEKSESKLLTGLERSNSEEIFSIDMKRSNNNQPTTPNSPILAGFIINSPIIDLTAVNNSPPEIVLDTSDIQVLNLSPLPKEDQNKRPSTASWEPPTVKFPKLSPIVRSSKFHATTAAHNMPGSSGTSTNQNFGAIPKTTIPINSDDDLRHRSDVLKKNNDGKALVDARGHIKIALNDMEQRLNAVQKSKIQVSQQKPRQPPAPPPSLNGQVCQEIYQKLRAMFPDLKKDYIKKFCPPAWAQSIAHDVQLGTIIDKLLANEESWQIDSRGEDLMNRPTTSHNVGNVDETCEYLAGIFPNADPHYLRKVAVGFKDQSAVEAFVEEKLQTHDYPTREQYLAKLKITQEQERYTNNFVVADFVKIFPDPFTHFEDAKRKCKYNLVPFEFLKSIYNRIRVNTISKAYSQSNYNMSLAAKRLNQCQDFMTTRRRSREIPTEDIPMLQEMAFIRHQDAIRRHIESIKAEERKEFDKLRANGGLVQCQCCYDDECMPSKCSTCDNGHIFCNSCVITGTDSKLGDGETHVPCFLACGSEFSLSTLQKIIVPTKFSILLKKRQAAEVMAAGLQGLVSCPFCHFASIPAEGDKVFKCLNPECMKESCIQCQEPNHVPLRCNEVEKQDKARKYIEEKMTQALARTCYKCKKSFFKDEGCNKITCPCGAVMCFICDKPIKDYSHFRGQGSNDATKCPLWSDNNRLNAEAVRKVAEEARNQLLRADPSLNINTEALAPTLPPPTAGPHTDILGAENVAIQLAARVMRDERQ